MENTNTFMEKYEREREEERKAIKEFEKKNPKPAPEYCPKHKSVNIVEYVAHFSRGTKEVTWEKAREDCEICKKEEEEKSDYERRGREATIPQRYTDVPPSEQYLDIVEGGKGILFTGGVGTGKTYQLVALMKELLKRGESVKFQTFGEISRNIRDSIGENEYSNVYRKYVARKIFIMDDLGVENNTPFMKEFLYNLINDLYNENKILLISTNLNSTELIDCYSQRVVSRLSEMCQIVELKGGDKRRGSNSKKLGI